MSLQFVLCLDDDDEELIAVRIILIVQRADRHPDHAKIDDLDTENAVYRVHDPFDHGHGLDLGLGRVIDQRIEVVVHRVLVLYLIHAQNQSLWEQNMKIMAIQKR